MKPVKIEKGAGSNTPAGNVVDLLQEGGVEVKDEKKGKKNKKRVAVGAARGRGGAKKKARGTGDGGEAENVGKNNAA